MHHETSREFRRLPVSRLELFLALSITAVGLAARFACLDLLAVEHFDEGVYASNLWFPDAGYQYPDRFLYAPPLVPALIEWSIILFGPQKWAPFLPSLLLGSFTVPLAWWSLRRWVNPPAGIAAAALIALNDFHIVMSRSALTDAPLAFFLMLAVWLTVEAFAHQNLKLAGGAGVAAGVAWTTKYNGWLPLAIAVSGGIAAWLFAPRARERTTSTGSKALAPISPKSVLSALAVMLIATTLTWSPVWWELQDVGGYSRVAENHRRYLVGREGWLSGAFRHGAVQRHYAGWPTLLSAWLAVIAAGTLMRRERSTWNASVASGSRSSRSHQDQTGPGPERSTWNGSSGIDTTIGSTLPPDGRAAGERSTWNGSSAASSRERPADSGRLQRSTWNGSDTAGINPADQTRSQFAGTLTIAGGLAGAIVLTPLLVLSLWSLTELGAILLSLRSRLQDLRGDVAGFRASAAARSGKRSAARSAARRGSEVSDENEDDESPATVERRRWFGAWLHLAWLCGLLLATPLYRPYPRLVLPLLTVAWLGTGAAIVRLLTGKLVTGQTRSSSPTGTAGSQTERSDEGHSEANRRSTGDPHSEADLRSAHNRRSEAGLRSNDSSVRSDEGRRPGAKKQAGPQTASPAVTLARQRRRFAWLVPIVALCLWRAATSEGTTWQQRSGLARIAERAVVAAAADVSEQPAAADGVRFVMYVYGEPGLFFHIPREGVPVQPVMDLSFARPDSKHPDIPTFLLAGPHAWNSSSYREQFLAVRESLELVEAFPYRPSDFVLLEDHRPERLPRHRETEVRLYRVRSQ